MTARDPGPTPREALAKRMEDAARALQDLGFDGDAATCYEAAALLAAPDAVGEEISASEALFGFMGWLTSRQPPVTFSSTHGASIAVELIEEWSTANALAAPRDDFHLHIEHPASPVGESLPVRATGEGSLSEGSPVTSDSLCKCGHPLHRHGIFGAPDHSGTCRIAWCPCFDFQESAPISAPPPQVESGTLEAEYRGLRVRAEATWEDVGAANREPRLSLPMRRKASDEAARASAALDAFVLAALRGGNP